MPGPHDPSARSTQVLSPASTSTRIGLGLGLVGVTLLAVLLVAADAPAEVRVLPVLVAAGLLPGYPLVARLPVDLPTLLALDVCGSLAVDAAAAFVLVQAHAWHPQALALALAVAGVGASLVTIVALRLGTRSGGPLLGDVTPGDRARHRDSDARGLMWCLPPAIACALWLAALASTEAEDLPRWGIVPLLGWSFWAALVLVLGSAIVLSQSGRLRHGALLAHLAVLLTMLYATAPALEQAPRYTYTYKHIAIAQYIERYGEVDKAIDIYHRWPGFFSLSAWFSQVTGLLDPTSYAAWAELFFSTIDALLVWACVQGVARSARTAWQATLLFAVTNWVGQNYYSPQAFGYVLMLGVLLLCLVALRARPGPFGRWVEHRVGAVFRVKDLDRPDHEPMPGVAFRRVVGLAILLDAMLAATHQLTPYVLLLQLGALVLAGYLRPWWVLVVATAATVGYLIPNYDFVVHTFGLLTSADPLANATSKTGAGTPDSTQRLISLAALGSLLTCFLLGFVGMVRRARRGHVSDAVVVGALAFLPVLTLLAQNYGGEARLRVFLYALPWLCAGVAWSWSPEGEPRTGLRLLRPAGVVAALTAAFVAFFFGREDINQLSRGEVGAAAYLFDPKTVQPGAVIMLVAPNFPARYGPLYFRLALADLPALSYGDFGERPLLFASESDVEAAATLIEREKGSSSYLVFSRGQEAFSRDYQLYSAHALKAFEGAVARSPRFRLVYAQPTARVYELVRTQ